MQKATFLSLANFQEGVGDEPIPVSLVHPDRMVDGSHLQDAGPEAFEEFARQIVAEAAAQDNEKARRIRSLYEADLERFLAEGQEIEQLRSNSTRS